MISKIYRLKENDISKVLWKRSKPFFSYSLVLNVLQNRKNYNRFSIVIWARNVTNNITRNFFRRLFYTEVRKYINQENDKFHDFSVIIKKESKLDKKDNMCIKSFVWDISFVFSKFFDQKETKFNFKKQDK